jgi:hypothetical protein
VHKRRFATSSPQSQTGWLGEWRISAGFGGYLFVANPAENGSNL